MEAAPPAEVRRASASLPVPEPALNGDTATATPRTSNGGATAGARAARIKRFLIEERLILGIHLNGQVIDTTG